MRRGCWLYQSTRILVVLTLLSICIEVSHADPAYDSSGIYDEVGLSTSEVLRLRGYNAVDHTVITQDGYALNLVEACNPLINYTDNSDLANKEVVLFIHGTLFNATCFIDDTPKPAGPHDFSRLNASQMSVQQIYDLYDGSPNVESLVFLLLDYGHRVFLLNRRNTVASQQAYAMQNNKSFKEDQPNFGNRSAAAIIFDPASINMTVNPLSYFFAALSEFADPEYWNFSLDEMAKYDLPDTIEYILKLTNRSTLAAVGWSSGGAIIEMGLSTQPALNEKISKSLLWSSSLYLGRSIRDALFYQLSEPLLNLYIGPVPPQFINDIIDYLAIQSCQTEAAQGTICGAVVDSIAGYGDNQQLLKPGFLNSAPAPTSSHEIAQLGQAATYGKSHYYNYGVLKNTFVYGSPKPPIYDVSKITSNGLYFWGAANDGLVSIDAVTSNVADLSVKAVYTRFDEPGLYFEHFSYLWHKNKSQLLFIPSLRILES